MICSRCGKDKRKKGSSYCRECANAWTREKYHSNTEHRKRHIEKVKERMSKIKFDVLKYYSNGKLECECCGESLYEFLEIDHINGGGCKHRKKIKAAGGQMMYQWLVTNKYPPGFRVLCSNCNNAYGRYGYCPHKGSRFPKGD